MLLSTIIRATADMLGVKPEQLKRKKKGDNKDVPAPIKMGRELIAYIATYKYRYTYDAVAKGLNYKARQEIGDLVGKVLNDIAAYQSFITHIEAKLKYESEE